MIYNILDYPAGVLPVKVVLQEDLKNLKNSITSKGEVNDRLTEFIRIS